MNWKNSKARYGTVPQLIHWLTALFVIVGWLLGQFHDVLPRGGARAFGLLVHMSLGESVAVLLLLRLVWRLVNPPPVLEPTAFGRVVAIAARLSHFTLYALLLAVPFLGIIVQLKRGHPLPLFGLADFSSPWPADRAVARTVLTIHKWLADALLILAGIHASAAIVHHWLWRDRTLVRMLPGRA